jgi:hypothetical protein
MDDKFLKVAVKSVVKTQVDILAAAKGAKKYDLVGDLVEAAWQTAKEAGLVTDVMLENATVSSLPCPIEDKHKPLISIYEQRRSASSRPTSVEPA